MTQTITKEQFVEQYKEVFSLSDESLGDRVVVPCTCKDSTCPGWAMVENNPTALAAHAEFLLPKVTKEYRYDR